MKRLLLVIAIIGNSQCAKLDHLKYLPPNNRPTNPEPYDQGLSAPKTAPTQTNSEFVPQSQQPSASSPFGGSTLNHQASESFNGGNHGHIAPNSPSTFSGPSFGSSSSGSPSAAVGSNSESHFSKNNGIPSKPFSAPNQLPSNSQSTSFGPQSPSSSYGAAKPTFPNSGTVGSGVGFAQGSSFTHSQSPVSPNHHFNLPGGYSSSPAAETQSTTGSYNQQPQISGDFSAPPSKSNGPGTFSHSAFAQQSHNGNYNPAAQQTHGKNGYTSGAQHNFGGNVANNQAKYQSNQNQIPIIRLDTTNDGDGTYSTSYETGNGIVAEEQGQTQGDNSVAQGSFSYTSPEGEKVGLSYTADEDGYHPQGEHLPTPPPVPDAILKSLEFNKNHPEQENDDGSYRDESQSGVNKPNGQYQSSFGGSSYSGSSNQYLAPKQSSFGKDHHGASGSFSSMHNNNQGKGHNADSFASNPTHPSAVGSGHSNSIFNSKPSHFNKNPQTGFTSKSYQDNQSNNGPFSQQNIPKLNSGFEQQTSGSFGLSKASKPTGSSAFPSSQVSGQYQYSKSSQAPFASQPSFVSSTSPVKSGNSYNSHHTDSQTFLNPNSGHSVSFAQSSFSNSGNGQFPKHHSASSFGSVSKPSLENNFPAPNQQPGNFVGQSGGFSSSVSSFDNFKSAQKPFLSSPSGAGTSFNTNSGQAGAYSAPYQYNSPNKDSGSGPGVKNNFFGSNSPSVQQPGPTGGQQEPVRTPGVQPQDENGGYLY